MHAKGETHKRGNLYSLSTDHTCRNEVSGFQVFNSLAWTRDGAQVFFSDSRGHAIFTADYDLARGRIFNKRIWKRTDPAWGVPDGAAMDAEGCYWVAFFGGAKLVRYRLDGTIDREIPVPCQRPTMPCLSSTSPAAARVTRRLIFRRIRKVVGSSAATRACRVCQSRTTRGSVRLGTMRPM